MTARRTNPRFSKARKLFCMATTAAIVFFPTYALAFKVETHVWVGQQVLNDLQDGYISIPMHGGIEKIKVEPMVVDAIRQYPSIYRMGNVGPDAFPDIATGQLLAHPGIASEWQTDDWLRYLLQYANTPKQRAFAYGYLGHAATDVFAHTNVNHYSGDVFSFLDGEQDVEARHIAMENYIGARTPSIRDVSGNIIGQAHELVKTPAAEILERLIMNDTVAKQNRKGGMMHLYLVHELRKTLKNTRPTLDKMDALATQAIVGYTAGIALNNRQATFVANAANTLLTSFDFHQFTGVDQMQSAKNELDRLMKNVVGLKASAHINLNRAFLDVIKYKGELDETILKITSTASKAAEEVCETALKGPIFLCPTFKKPLRSCEVEKLICKATRAATNAKLLLPDLILAQELEQTLLTNAVKTLNLATKAARDATISAIDSQNVALNGAIDTAQILTDDVNPLRAYVNGWIKDIDDGMLAYVETSGEMIKRSMSNPRGNMLEALLDWKRCWGLSITGVLPGPANNSLCEFTDHLQDIVITINKLVDDVLALTPVGVQLVSLKNRVKQDLTRIATDLANELAKNVTGKDVKRFYSLYSKSVSADELNAIFSEDTSGKGLAKLSNISARLDAEMSVRTEPDTGKPVFNPEKYAAARNAVLLAKLSLLGPKQLNELATRVGMTNSTLFTDASPLYSSTRPPSNLLIDSIRSIDGSHQWMGLAPAYPRAPGCTDKGWPEERHYGYGYAGGFNNSVNPDKIFDGKKGFRLYQDKDARARIFNAIFEGPFTPELTDIRNWGSCDDQKTQLGTIEKPLAGDQKGNDATPKPVWPKGNIGVPSYPTYKWIATSGASDYYLTIEKMVGRQWQVLDHSKFSAAAVNCPQGTGNCEIRRTNINLSGQIRWKVMAKVNGVKTPWSQLVGFTVGAGNNPGTTQSAVSPPAIPSLYWPAGNKVNRTPSYKWASVTGAQAYYVEVRTATGSAPIWYKQISASDASCSGGNNACEFIKGDMNLSGDHKWRVRSENSAGPSEWSSWKNFYVGR